MNRKFITKGTILLGVAASLAACTSQPEYHPDITRTSSLKGTDLFHPDSASIARSYVMPKWFQDGKLGIFIHWGVYSVPAYGSEWYSRWMYQKDSKIHKYHVDTYGPVDKFGYKDFIPMFQSPKFDAAEWAKLFKESGATYVVPVAEHHDGFSMYKSSYNHWNSVEMGPKIDVIGELSKTVRAEGMKFGLSSHRSENAWFYNGGMEIPSDVQDMSISLYGERLPQPGGQGMTAYAGENEGSNEKSRKEFLMHTYELIDQYQPDLIWFDWTVGKYPFQPTFYKFMAYYYNNAKDWGKDVVINTKVGYGDNIQIFDIERGKSDRILRYPWQTDTSVGKKSWSYTPTEENKTPNHIIDDFVDIVAKNGNLLLNIGPKSDGSITPEQQDVLRNLGAWLKVNGEAIYNTRPWVRWGEGNEGTSGYMTDGQSTEYVANDIRYTANEDALYAISLAWTEGEITLGALAKANGDNMNVSNVSLLGSDEEIKWEQTKDGLKIQFPAKQPTDYAHAFKIEYDGVAFGDLQLNPINGNLIAEQYIRNNTDEATTYTLACAHDGAEAVTKTVTVPAHETVITEFTYPMTDSDSNRVDLSINGQAVASKTHVKKAGRGVHNME